MPISPAVLLPTPPLARFAPDGVFDDFGWCASTTLDWRCRRDRPFDVHAPIDGSDPERMVFVFHAECTFLPRELARLHAFGLGLEEELALAPYAIDDATDGFHARGVAPASMLWLAADNANALYWGLHDWAHFHNHGPFERRAWTELQCDAAALHWIELARPHTGMTAADVARVRRQVADLAARRFVDEGEPAPPDLLARLEVR